MIAGAKRPVSAPGHRLGRGAAAVVLGCVLVGYLMSLRNEMWPPSHAWSGMTLVGLALLNLGLPSRLVGLRRVVLVLVLALSVAAAFLWLMSALIQVSQ